MNAVETSYLARAVAHPKQEVSVSCFCLYSEIFVNNSQVLITLGY